jgi:PKD repeat protein
MKPGSNLLWSQPFLILLAAVSLGLVGNATHAHAEAGSAEAPTTGAATEVLLSADVLAEEPCLVVIAVTATDPNSPITSLTADLSGLPPGNDATFVTNATNTAGTLIWHPGEPTACFITFTAIANGQSTSTAVAFSVAPEVQALGTFQWFPTAADAGTYTVTFTAVASDGETFSLAWPLTVITEATVSPNLTRSSQHPSGQAPARGPIISIGTCGQCGGEGAEIDTVHVGGQISEYFEIWLYVSDPDGESIVSLTADTTNLPSDNTATFTATLGATARPGGPYSGVVGVPVEFNGTASSGSPLVWDFGDSNAGEGVMPSHAYTMPGIYRVTLAAGAPVIPGTSLGDCDTTSVVISDVLPARAFVADGHRSTPDGPASQSLCIQVEPVNGDYDNAQVDGSTFAMYLDVPGSTAHISALSGKTMVVADRDRNGVQEIAVCFGRQDLGQFLDAAPNRQTVPVLIVADVNTGGTLQAKLDLNLVSTGGSLASSVHPNPLRETGTVIFDTSKPGPVKALLFDLRGRLVRTLLVQPQAARGRHEIQIDGRDDRGRRLASGIYLYRVEAAEGVATGRIVVLQ